uniref:Uncharacterized protein n=1 Tax=Coccolithus braarudii TaxID=221442 RepID=A0A7S0LA14_9EUKA
MSRFLALWRLRRGMSAVRCLLYLEAKMRRLRALRKLRYTAAVAAKVGLSWVRRAKEIRYGVAVTNIQKYARGHVSRRRRKKRLHQVVEMQSMARGFLAKRKRKALYQERREEMKRKAKEERERKIRDRREAMEARERDQAANFSGDMRGGTRTGQQARAGDRLTRGSISALATGLPTNRTIDYQAGQRIRQVRVRKEGQALSKVGGGAAAAATTGSAAASAAASAAGGEEEFEYMDVVVDANGEAVEELPPGAELMPPGAEARDDDAMSEGSDLLVQDSDEEEEMLTASQLQNVSESSDSMADLQNPKQLLAATAALGRKSQSSGSSAAVPGLKTSAVGESDDVYGSSGAAGSGTLRRTPTMMSRMKAQALGSMTPRSTKGQSGLFSARGRSGSITDTKRLFLTKTAKGSLVAAGMFRVSKTSGWQERMVLVVGDVLFVFMLATQPELPIGLRLWPGQVLCLNQSVLALPTALPEVSDASFSVMPRQQGLGALQLQHDDHETMKRFAAAMHLGVGNVRRARQQAKLSLAQQLFHEKKLSLLKTQHMIELLHKSQEMFFEAGSGQFDDCNAVCMHSGTMRQSLIDVTPFMPVSDFVCEYCSCVIIPEEQADKAGEALETRQEEHGSQLKREKQRKLQLDDETLMVARDVRVLRQRRKTAQEEASAAWTKVQEAISERQHREVRVEQLKTLQMLSTMDKSHVEMLRSQLQEQLASARRQRDALQAQHAIRQARLQGVDAELDPEEEINRATTLKAKPAEDKGNAAKRNPGFAKDAGDGTVKERKSSFGRNSAITRVLSFGKKKNPKPSEGGEETKKESVGGALARKISFGRKK